MSGMISQVFSNSENLHCSDYVSDTVLNDKWGPYIKWKKNQSQKDKHCITTLTWDIDNTHNQTYGSREQNGVCQGLGEERQMGYKVLVMQGKCKRSALQHCAYS